MIIVLGETNDGDSNDVVEVEVLRPIKLGSPGWPATMVPVWPNPIVESTVIIESSGDTDSTTLDAPGILKVPSC